MDALSPERLEELRPPWDEHTSGTWRAVKWYNEAPKTAAYILVSAAQESSKFREEFISQEMEEVLAFPEEDGANTTVNSPKWRSTLKEELPKYHKQFESIKLSASQGGYAEQIARRELTNE